MYYFTVVHCSKEKDDLREEVLFSSIASSISILIHRPLRIDEYFSHLLYISREIVRFLVSGFRFSGKRAREREKVRISHLLFLGSRETRKSYEIDVHFIRTVESHLSISMAVLVVRSKFNPARKSRILIGGYNFAADRRCFSHPSSSVSPFEN